MQSSCQLSVVMPVFNTGALLLASVRSVVAQTLFAGRPASEWELLIVDDGSNDPATVQALDAAVSLSPSVRLLKNRRAKGVAGARNTGIRAARGEWVGFLDSDDLWYPEFLERQRTYFEAHPEANWRAAHFEIGDQHAQVVRPTPLSRRSPFLYSKVAAEYERGAVSRLRRPVETLLQGGCIGIMTVQVRRELLLQFGGFDESFRAAEDYDLWLRLAAVQDLYVAPHDAAIYRVRPGSLTHGGKPMYFFEDRMLRRLRRSAAHRPFRSEIDGRLHRVYAKFCFDYRERKRFISAASCAVKLIAAKPHRPDGWKHLAATMLLR